MRTQLGSLRDRLRSRNEKGYALLTALGVTLVIGVIASTLAASTAFGASFIERTTSQEQAKDQAISQQNAIVADILTKGCSSTTLAKWPDAIYSSSAAVAPQKVFKDESKESSLLETGVSAGCPEATDKWLLVRAQGVSTSGLEKVRDIAVFKWEKLDSGVIPQVLTAGGTVYLNATSVSRAAGVYGPSVISAGGRFECYSTLDGMVDASVKSTGSASQTTTMSNCTLKGSLKTGASVKLTSSNIIGDACWLSTGSTATADQVKGTITANTKGCSTPGVGYGYVPDKGADIVASGSTCTLSGLVSTIETLADPTVVDISSCGTELEGQLANASVEKKFSVKSSIVLLVGNNDFKNVDIVNAASTPSRLSFVRPASAQSQDAVACSGSITTRFYTDIQYAPGTSGIIYNPCTVYVQSSTIRGQIYAGANILMLGNSEIIYQPVPLPNTTIVPRLPEGTIENLVRVY